MILDGSNGVTFNDASLQGAAASPYVLKNRIINGAMVIDQRNAGAAVTVDGAFPLDRWKIILDGGGALSAQRSTTAPAGYTNSLYITATTADTSLGTSDEYSFRHAIEGFNVADLGWGTANAQTVTLSFKVRSSVTGTYGGVLRNSAGDRIYVFSYTINSANAWEDKSVTIAGDTSGTWLTDNGIGIQLIFSLGAGSSRLASAGSWGTTAGVQGVTGQTQWISTLNATFYITGVQLEQNTSATPFERRLYGQELINCQRYFEKSYDLATLPGTGGTPNGYTQTFANNGVTTAGYIGCSERFKVEKRAAPTMTSYDWSGNAGKCTRGTLAVGNDANQTWAFESSTTSSWIGYSSGSANRATVFLYWTASIEL
jgi:hypothetical protein